MKNVLQIIALLLFSQLAVSQYPANNHVPGPNAEGLAEMPPPPAEATGNMAPLKLTLVSITPSLNLFAVKLASTGGTGARKYRQCQSSEGAETCTDWQTSSTFPVAAGQYKFQVKDATGTVASLDLTVPKPN